MFFMFLAFVILIAVIIALVQHKNKITAQNEANHIANILRNSPTSTQKASIPPLPKFIFTVTTCDSRRQPRVIKLDLGGEPVVITIDESARVACEEAARKMEHSFGDISVLKRGFDVDVLYKGEIYCVKGTNGRWYPELDEYVPEQAALDPLVLEAIGFDAAKWEIRPAKDNFKSPKGLHKLDISVQNELNEIINNQPTKFIKDNYYLFNLASGQEFAVGISLINPWVDVIARGRKKGEKNGLYTAQYGIHGFHAEESRWSFGSGPPGATEIRKLLHEHFGTPEKRGRFV